MADLPTPEAPNPWPAFGADLFHDVLRHRDEMGHLANAPADDLRDALRYAADRYEALAARLGEARTLLTEMIRYMDEHRISVAGCSTCGGHCFEEWCLLKDEAAALLREDTPTVTSGPAGDSY